MSLELHKDRQETDELIDRADDEAGREQLRWDRIDRLNDYAPAGSVALTESEAA